MKLRSYVTIALAVVLTAAIMLTGCAAEAVPSPEADVSAAAQSAVDPDAVDGGTREASTAVESAVTLTPEQTAAEERERKDEIERQYSMYEPFGLTYDRDKDLFFYEGKTVRYFKDMVNLWNTNGFFYENGVVDLVGKRDDAGELTGLDKAAQEEFDLRTAEHEKFGGSTVAVSEAIAYESGDPGAFDSSLDQYKPYGVLYDRAAKAWMFGGRPIHIFYDENGATYVDGSSAGGINVKVVCDSEGKLDRIVEMTEADIRKMIE